MRGLNTRGFLKELDRRGLCARSKKKYLIALRHFSRMQDGPTVLSRAQIDRFFFWLRDNDELKNGSKDDYWTRFKVYVRWARPGIKIGGYRFRAIRTMVLPEGLLSAAEARSISNCSKGLRNRAMLALLYDTGCRPEELRALRRQDIAFDPEGLAVRIRGKTGHRRIRVVTTLDSDRLMKEYLRVYPSRVELLPISDTMLEKIVRKAARRACIDRKVVPRLFRHSRATELAGHFTDAQMCVYFGWKPGSRMVKVYAHLSGRDLDPKVLELNSRGIFGGGLRRLREMLLGKEYLSRGAPQEMLLESPERHITGGDPEREKQVLLCS